MDEDFKKIKYNEELQKEVKNKIKRNTAAYKENEEERSVLLEQLGV